jgi:hypothetical protein
MFAKDKHSSLFDRSVSDEEKVFTTLTTTGRSYEKTHWRKATPLHGKLGHFTIEKNLTFHSGTIRLEN